MRTKTLLVVSALFLACWPRAAAAAADASRYEDRAYGFSVTVPALGDSGGAVIVQRLMVAGPARDGFAPNCNVQVQFPDMDFRDFMDLTHRQFQEAGLKVVKDEPRKVSGQPAAVIDYHGALGGRDLHFLALAVSGGDRVWLLTCTAPASTFAEHEAAFRQAIDSFAVTPPKKSG